MRKPVVVLACAFLLIAACSSSGSGDRARTVRCESEDDAYRECGAAGEGSVSLVTERSRSACVQGQSWGVRNGMLWVDRGCRADFLVGSTEAASSDATLVCESHGSLRRCGASTGAGVRLVRQLSDSPCTFNETWGWDVTGVWVNEGCRAEFSVGAATPRNTALVVCESTGNRRNHCRAETRYGVELVRQLSDSACVRNRTWGEDSDGIWVSEGCRGEFAVQER